MTPPEPLAALPAGLSDDEARARLARDGPNRLPQAARRPLHRIALQVLMQPMIALLSATALVYALLGSAADSIGLALSVLLVAAIAVYQQQRTERVLDSLRDLASPRARVVRSGRVQRVPSHELVRGDVMLLAEGDRLACDARLLRAESLLVDESMLSGESAPVLKQAPRDARGATIDPLELVFAGTLVVQGQGVAQVRMTGAHTALGRIGSSLAQIAPRPSRVQAELERTVRWVALFAVVASLLVAALHVAQHGRWSDGLLAGLTLAMALIPEEFAVVWTVMMALGAWRLARQQVLTRQPQAIEALGTTSVLAVDKTGTLTVNRMALLALAMPQAQAGEREQAQVRAQEQAQVRAQERAQEQAQVRLAPGDAAPAALMPLLEAAARAAGDEGIEPMDRAIHRLRADSGVHKRPPALLLHRSGIAPGRLYVAHWWREATGAGRVVVKGAPESVRTLCTFDADAAAAAEQAAAAMAQQGLRVLAVAEGAWDSSKPPPDAPPPSSLRWCGLLGFLDPLRADVPQAMAQCRAAGIRVVMITGDAPLTARAIAREAQLCADDDAAEVLTGAQVAALDDAALRARISEVSICARVSPEQKLRIVRALQAQGQVVAMTGDGVNDAPALRAADIGVAMGERGTDVAREAASLVLQVDSFASLVAGVRLGRRIFRNLKQSVGYLLAVHVPIVGVALLPMLIGGPQLLLPLHVVFLELLIDPACSLVFEAEPEPADCMRVPPRPAHVGLLSWRALGQALAVGGIGLAAVVALQVLARAQGWSDEACRAAALGSVIVGNVAMLVWFRAGERPRHLPAFNAAFLWLQAALASAAGLVLAWTPLTRQFGLPGGAAVQAAGVGLLLLGVSCAAWLRRRG